MSTFETCWIRSHRIYFVNYWNNNYSTPISWFPQINNVTARFVSRRVHRLIVVSLKEPHMQRYFRILHVRWVKWRVFISIESDFALQCIWRHIPTRPERFKFSKHRPKQYYSSIRKENRSNIQHRRDCITGPSTLFSRVLLFHLVCGESNYILRVFVVQCKVIKNMVSVNVIVAVKIHQKCP